MNLVPAFSCLVLQKEKYLAFEEPPVGLQVWGYLPDTPVRLLRNIFSSYGAVTDLRLSNYVAEDQVRYGWLYVAFNDYDPVDYLTCKYWFHNMYHHIIIKYHIIA